MKCRTTTVHVHAPLVGLGAALATSEAARPHTSFSRIVLVLCAPVSRAGDSATVCVRYAPPGGSLHEYMGHVSNRGVLTPLALPAPARLYPVGPLTLPLAALMTRISSVVIEGAHTSAGAATLAPTVPFWGRFRNPREPTAGPSAGAYCRVPQTLRRPAITYSCLV